MATRDELKICGLAAVRSRFQQDAASIRRLYFDDATGRKLGVICKALAAARKVYRCVEPAELEKIGGTIHHGGVVAVVTAPALREVGPEEAERWASRKASVLILDRIGNAHNLGAIARTAAFFGVEHLVVAADPAAAGLSEAAYRVAEGGLEHVRVWQARDLVRLVHELRRRGYDVVAAATRGGRPSARTAAPLALVVGNEEAGLDPALAAACSRQVTLPGSGQVESLNVSVAAGILLYALLQP